MNTASTQEASSSLPATSSMDLAVIALPRDSVISSSGTTARSCATRMASASRPPSLSL